MEVAARMEFGGSEDVINVYQFRVIDIGDSDDLAIIDDLIDIMEVIYDNLDSTQTVELTYEDLSFRNITQDTTFGAFGWDSLTAGIASSDATAPGVCALINFATFLGKVILKKYFGVFTEGVTDADGTWSSVLVALLVTIGQYLLGDIVGTAATYQYGYLSPKAGGFVLPVAATISDIPAYQRRRKQGRGS